MSAQSTTEYLDSKVGIKPIVDHMYVHNDDIGGAERHVTNVIGDFHGNPIIQWNPRATEERETREAIRRIGENRAADLVAEELRKAEEATGALSIA